MNAIKQFVYTASPWGKSDPGWMTFATSPEFDDVFVKRSAHWFRYVIPSGMSGDPDEAQIADYPVQFVVARPFDDGALLLSQTTFTGRRWYDPRPGDWLAHGFIVPHSLLASDCSNRNPFAWLGSRRFIKEYKEEWKEKAVAISERRIPWEAPPDLPTLESLDQIEPNPDFEWNAVLDRFKDDGDGVWPKLGGLLAACVKRGDGAKAFVFDATKPKSLDTMAALLPLMPEKLRLEAQFSTYFHADNVRETKADETFLFYGEVREGETCDAHTGLYGEPPQGGPEFRNHEDVDLFKRMVDVGGEALGKDDFENLVSCWEMAAGREGDVRSLRKAVEFAKRFDGMVTMVELGLSDPTDPMVAIVGWFEQGLARFKDNARQVCSDCVSNGLLFAKALQTLEGEGPQAAFADTVFKTARNTSALNDLAEMLRGCDLAILDGDIAKFATCANRMVGIRQNVNDGRVSAENAESMLKEIGVAERDFGSVFGDMEEVKRKLQYLSALSRLKNPADIKAFVDEAETLGVSNDVIRTAVLDHVRPGEIPAEQVFSATEEYKLAGIYGEEVVRQAIDAAMERGREEGKQQALAANQMANAAATGSGDRTANAERQTAERRVVPGWLAALIAFLAFIIGLFAGIFCFVKQCAPSEDEAVRAPVHVPRKVDTGVQHESPGKSFGVPLPSESSSDATGLGGGVTPSPPKSPSSATGLGGGATPSPPKSPSSVSGLGGGVTPSPPKSPSSATGLGGGVTPSPPKSPSSATGPGGGVTPSPPKSPSSAAGTSAAGPGDGVGASVASQSSTDMTGPGDGGRVSVPSQSSTDMTGPGGGGRISVPSQSPSDMTSPNGGGRVSVTSKLPPATTGTSDKGGALPAAKPDDPPSEPEAEEAPVVQKPGVSGAKSEDSLEATPPNSRDTLPGKKTDKDKAQ